MERRQPVPNTWDPTVANAIPAGKPAQPLFEVRNHTVDEAEIPGSVQDRIGRAFRAIEDGQLDDAALLVDSLIADDCAHTTPDAFLAACSRLAIACLFAHRPALTRRYLDAATSATRSLADAPSNHFQWALKATDAAWHLQERHDQAPMGAVQAEISELSSQGELSEEHAIPTLVIGVMLALDGLVDRAAAQLLVALTLLPPGWTVLRTTAQLELALVKMRLGEWDECAALASAAHEAARWQSGGEIISSCLAALALIPAGRGDSEYARRLLKASIDQQMPTVLSRRLQLHARIALAISEANWAELHEVVRDYSATNHPHHFRVDEWRALDVLALANLGKMKDVELKLADWARIPDAFEHAYFHAWTAISAILMGRLEKGLEALDRAVEALKPLDDPLGRAWVHVMMGITLARLSRWSEGQSIIAAAKSDLRRLGALHFIEQCDEIISRIRLWQGGEARRNLPLLTSRQNTVASLVAGGLTSQQVADELNIAKSTVDFHIANILRLLGLRTRRQLTQLLRQDLLGPGPYALEVIAALRPLNARQRHIAELVTEGYTSVEIARRAQISPSTVNYHIAAILKITKLPGRRELGDLVTEGRFGATAFRSPTETALTPEREGGALPEN